MRYAKGLSIHLVVTPGHLIVVQHVAITTQESLDVNTETELTIAHHPTVWTPVVRMTAASHAAT
jgi:hypothetical protein